MFKVLCCRIVVWGKGLTLYQLHQIYSRRLSKDVGKNMENLCKWIYNYRIDYRVENIVAKWAITPFATRFSKVICCKGVRESLQVGKGLHNYYTNVKRLVDALMQKDPNGYCFTLVSGNLPWLITYKCRTRSDVADHD